MQENGDLSCTPAADSLNQAEEIIKIKHPEYQGPELRRSSRSRNPVRRLECHQLSQCLAFVLDS